MASQLATCPVPYLDVFVVGTVKNLTKSELSKVNRVIIFIMNLLQ